MAMRGRLRMRWAAVACVAALGVGPAPADEPKRGGAADDSPLRLFHVDALVAGRPDFIGERMGIVAPDGVSDETRPLFGAEGEELVLPAGTADEIIDLLKAEVETDSWSTMSGVLLAPMGSGVIVARHRPEVVTALGVAIKRWEDRWLRTVTVDVAAVRLPAGGTAPADLAALVQGDAAGPAVSITAFPGQRVTAFGGRQHAYVQDYDVEVAQKARGGDPIVGVLSVGLAVDVRVVPSGAGDRVLLSLTGALSELSGAPAFKVLEGGRVEVPALGLTSIRSQQDIAAGAWTLLDGAAVEDGKPGWAFLVRARVNARARGDAGRGDPLPVLASAGMGRLERRAYGIDALMARQASWMGPIPSLMPSNFTPPEPPELPEPVSAIEPETLLELIRGNVAPEVWDLGSVEVRKDTLVVRAPETAQATVRGLLGALRRSLLWSVDVDAEVVEVPAALAAANEAVLSDAGAKELAAALEKGTAVRVDRLRASAMGSARNYVSAGKQRAYVRDFEVEIAEDSVTGNPVMGTAFSGAVVDLQPAVNSTWDGAAITVRFSRTWLPDELPTFDTTWGPIHVPEMRVIRLRTSLEVPFGKTAVVGSAADKGRRTLLLLTPTLRRAGE